MDGRSGKERDEMKSIGCGDVWMEGEERNVWLMCMYEH